MKCMNPLQYLLRPYIVYLAITLAFLGCNKQQPSPSFLAEQQSETAVASNTENEETQAIVQRLVSDGWQVRSAEAVVSLNAEWFSILTDENPASLELQVKLLSRLGAYPALQDILADHPQTAGLMASVTDPQILGNVLRNAVSNGEFDRIAGLFVQHSAPSDAERLAEALVADQDLICFLYENGLLGAEGVFVFDRKSAEAAEYDAWLRDVILSKASASEDDFTAIINLIILHGSSIREHMRRDESFRDNFRSQLWPKLVRTVESKQNAFELLLDEPRIWDLLALPKGEALLRQCGLLSVDLLYGNPDINHPPYPKSLHEKVIQILLSGKELPIHCLMKLRSEPQFLKLLERDLPTDVLLAAMAKIHQAGPNYPEKLSYFEPLSDRALAEEVGPPPSGPITWIPFYYTLYEVPKKRLQGREPTGMELFSAVLDPVFLAVDIASFGQGAVGRKLIIAGGKEATERVTKELAEKGVEKALVTTLRDSALELATKRLGKEIAQNMGEKELAQWGISSMLSQMQQLVKSTVRKSTTFEITKPIQFMFKYTGVGRQSWKRWTGLEARLFMRGDAKVFIRLGNVPKTVLGPQAVAFLNRTATDLSANAAVESETGQELLKSGASNLLEAKEQLRAWHQHTSALWLFSASTPDFVGNAPEKAGSTESQK